MRVLGAILLASLGCGNGASRSASAEQDTREERRMEGSVSSAMAPEPMSFRNGERLVLRNVGAVEVVGRGPLRDFQRPDQTIVSTSLPPVPTPPDVEVVALRDQQ